MWVKVLVAVDGSERSAKAVQRALELAEQEGAKVTLISVAYYSSDMDEMPLNIQDKLNAEAKAVLSEAKALFDKKGIEVSTVLEAGVVPANNIIRKAEEGKFDLILLGCTGTTGVRGFLMGSTAAKVVAHASCSVAVIR